MTKRSGSIENMNIDTLIDGLRAGDRAKLAQAITLLESVTPADQSRQLSLLTKLYSSPRGAVRVGVTGIPGAGKSTLIDALGMELIRRGKRVAVLAIDPSSSLSGGSILGDKTRMESLSRDAAAFVRPSPSSGVLGGVALGTREAIIAVEAAGYDVVVVETIGVGQSEILVRSLVDVCILVSLTGGGDELQAIKRGILELADIIAINKADGDNREAAQSEALAIRQTRSVVSSYSPGWNVPVLATSATEGRGVDALCDALIQCAEHLKVSGQLERLRRSQNIDWFDERVTQALKVKWLGETGSAGAYRALRDGVLSGSKSPPEAVRGIVELLEK